ncbi:MAG: hypothetical protein JO316_25550 [Abitibacteriaceae bacterium]|nr:hypothetical protein [Abditibacteriaceae bacterium]MBV9868737.1 hypothetical protein [Abditibacteriaceae bacterium]
MKLVSRSDSLVRLLLLAASLLAASSVSSGRPQKREPLKKGAPTKTLPSTAPVQEASATGLHLSVEMERAEVYAGEQVVAKVTLRNESSTTISYWGVYDDESFTYTIKDWRGNVPLTRYGKLVIKPPGGPIYSVMVLTHHLKPGQEYKCRILLNRLYDMTPPGKYSITLQKIVGTEHQTVKLIAPPVTVNIKGFDSGTSTISPVAHEDLPTAPGH